MQAWPFLLLDFETKIFTASCSAAQSQELLSCSWGHPARRGHVGAGTPGLGVLGTAWEVFSELCQCNWFAVGTTACVSFQVCSSCNASFEFLFW